MRARNASLPANIAATFTVSPFRDTARMFASARRSGGMESAALFCAAKCRAVRPSYWKHHTGKALQSAQTRTTKGAQSRRTVAWLTLARCFNKIRMTSAWPLAAAIWSAVMPVERSYVFGSWPLLNRASTCNDLQREWRQGKHYSANTTNAQPTRHHALQRR